MTKEKIDRFDLGTMAKAGHASAKEKEIYAIIKGIYKAGKKLSADIQRGVMLCIELANERDAATGHFRPNLRPLTVLVKAVHEVGMNSTLLMDYIIMAARGRELDHQTSTWVKRADLSLIGWRSAQTGGKADKKVLGSNVSSGGFAMVGGWVTTVREHNLSEIFDTEWCELHSWDDFKKRNPVQSPEFKGFLASVRKYAAAAMKPDGKLTPEQREVIKETVAMLSAKGYGDKVCPK